MLVLVLLLLSVCLSESEREWELLSAYREREICTLLCVRICCNFVADSIMLCFSRSHALLVLCRLYIEWREPTNMMQSLRINGNRWVDQHSDVKLDTTTEQVLSTAFEYCWSQQSINIFSFLQMVKLHAVNDTYALR